MANKTALPEVEATTVSVGFRIPKDLHAQALLLAQMGKKNLSDIVMGAMRTAVTPEFDKLPENLRNLYAEGVTANGASELEAQTAIRLHDKGIKAAPLIPDDAAKGTAKK